MDREEFFSNLEKIGFFRATRDQLESRGWSMDLEDCLMHFYDFEDNENYLACWRVLAPNRVYLSLYRNKDRDSNSIQRRIFQDYDEAWEYITKR